jgi:predicted nucleic acid-binding protein
VFVDSNVLIYAVDAGEPVKSTVAERWLEAIWPLGTGRLSTQVLHEFYWNATRKLNKPLVWAHARRIVRRYESWLTTTIDMAMIESAWDVESEAGIAFWDALIVAAAQRADCRWLLTEDLQDGQCFGDLTVVDPFRHTPDEILGADGAGRVSEPPPKTRRRARAKPR